MKARGLFHGLRWALVFFVMLSTVAWAAEPAKKPTKTGVLKIGASQPLSGIMAPWGIPEAEIGQLYIDALNEDGGVTVGDTNYKLVFIASDDKATPDGIKASADRLVFTEKVNAIVGGFLMPIATDMGRAGATANIPVIHAVREAPGLDVVTPKAPTMFDLCWPQLQSMDMYIPALKKGALPNLKTYALISKDDTYGRSMMESILNLRPEWQTKYGLECVYHDIFPITAQDMTPWLSKIAALPKKADLIFAVSAAAPNMAMIAKQSYEMGLKVPVVTVPDLTDVREFIKICGYDAAQYVYTSGCGPWDYPKSSPKMKEMSLRILKAWKAKHGTDFEFGDAFEWVANQIALYVNAIKLANSVKTEDIVRVLETKPVEHFYGVSVASGEKTYGVRHILNYDAVISKVTGYEQKPVALVPSHPVP